MSAPLMLNERKKIAVVGDGSIGKTSLLIAHTERKFCDKYTPTIYETREHTLEVDGVSHKVMLYDTAGQEEYDKLRIEYLKNKQPDVIILCYAVDNMISFKNIQHKWIPELRNRTPIVLVATKIDIRRKTHISYEQGEELKKKIKAKSFVECSSKDFINIDSVFEEAVRVSIGQRNNIEDYFSRIKFQVLRLRNIFNCIPCYQYSIDQ